MDIGGNSGVVFMDDAVTGGSTSGKEVESEKEDNVKEGKNPDESFYDNGIYGIDPKNVFPDFVNPSKAFVTMPFDKSESGWLQMQVDKDDLVYNESSLDYTLVMADPALVKNISIERNGKDVTVPIASCDLVRLVNEQMKIKSLEQDGKGVTKEPERSDTKDKNDPEPVNTSGAVFMDDAVKDKVDDKAKQEEEAVVLSSVSAGAVFNTKNPNVKVVSIRLDESQKDATGIPSNAFTMVVNANNFKANRIGGKVVSYDVSLGEPGSMKEISYKSPSGNSYDRENRTVDFIKHLYDTFDQTYTKTQEKSQTKAAPEQSGAKSASGNKFTYVNYVDARYVRDAKDSKNVDVSLPCKDSENGALTMTIGRDSLIQSKNKSGQPVPGKFNIRLPGEDTLNPVRIKQNGAIVVAQMSSKDILAHYQSRQNAGRSSADVTKTTPDKSVEQAPVNKPDVQAGVSEAPTLRSEQVKAVEAANGQDHGLSDLASAMAFDGGFGM